MTCAHCSTPIDRRTAALKHDCDHTDAWWCVNAQPPCPVSFCCGACGKWTPAPVVTPPEPVLLDRNRKSPGDPGYDPRAVRPDPEFSPIEPQGTFWGEGVFDPAARYIDLNGKFHNAG